MPAKTVNPKKVLNERVLKSLRSNSQRKYVVWDSVLQNFGVRITDNGQCTFFIMRRLHGRLRRWSLGRYPAIEPEKARTKAREFLEDISRGIDPKIKQEKALREEEQRHKDTFSVVAEEFIQKHVSKLCRKKETEAAIRRELVSRWGKFPITEITRRDVIKILDEIVANGHIYAAHQILSFTRKLFNWAVSRDVYGLEYSPCDRIKPSEIIGKKFARQRVLDDDEIRVVWEASCKLDYPFGPLIKLLFLTGQRLREVAEMSWSEIDTKKATWTIPAARMKSDAAHVVPLSPDALALLNKLPRWTKGEFALTTAEGVRPISGFSKAKLRLDKQILDDLTKAVLSLVVDKSVNNVKEVAFDPWRFHDIRRTVRTHLSALPIQDIVRELVISHTKKGLHKVYDQWAYMNEKRQALELWAARLRSIVEPPPENVIPIRAAG